MKTKTFNINIEETNYFGVSVLTTDKKIYLKYFRFTSDNGIEDLEKCKVNETNRKAINELYKTAHCYFFDKDKEIKMWSY